MPRMQQLPTVADRTACGAAPLGGKVGLVFAGSTLSFTQRDRIARLGGTMNWEQIRGNWEKAKGELKVQWSKLTDDDLAKINGERDKLVGRLQELYGVTKEEAESQIDKKS